jgi:hypothetical protein
MTDERLTADVGRYWQAAASNVAPSAVSSDPLISGASPIEQVLRMLGLAANSGDLEDNAASIDEHARRAAMTSAAAGSFAAQDDLAAGDMTDIAPEDQSSATAAQQLPQLVAGIAAAVSGGLSGILQPFGQIPQQLAQGAQQVLQAGASLPSAGGGISVDDIADIDDASLLGEPSEADVGAAADDRDGFGSLPGVGAGLADSAGLSAGPTQGLTSAAPGVLLGPPATPSAATAPASAPGVPAQAPITHVPAAGSGAGMAGMPMIPPGGLHGAGVAERDAKADTKRIATPPVRNGAPVQGRITAAPPIITTTVEGRPVAARRIVMPSSGQTD